LFAKAVARAAELLRAGELVALPTETVYGLAANALDAPAVARIFAAKQRPPDNPIIVHVASLDMAKRCVNLWPKLADTLAAAFWPGPLTLVLPRSTEIPDIVAAAGPTVGVRWPSHPFVQAVIRACGFPLAAPSANLSGQISPTTAEHVLKALDGKISLIVDGGPSQVGIESTVLDLSVQPPRVLRPGMIQTGALWAVMEPFLDPSGNAGPAVHPVGAPRRSPGQLPKHYAPKARLVIWDWTSDSDLQSRISRTEFAPARCCVLAHTRIPAGALVGRVSVVPRDPESFARVLYAELHRCDEAGTGLIVVEALPNSPAWEAIADRLARAASGTGG
jgi:L-threonylcarbamoyladenylate synthase